jgi:hypothetical protein
MHYYYEKIDCVFVKDPIYYPYSYHVYFDSVQKNKIDIRTKYNLIKMLNNLSLLILYFNKETDDKKTNRLYSSKIYLSFSDNNLFNKEELILLFNLYSKINVIDNNNVFYENDSVINENSCIFNENNRFNENNNTFDTNNDFFNQDTVYS